MAKEIPIIIKVDGKELDVAKTSVDQFSKIYSDTQKKINSLPIGSEDWKKLNTELKNADKTFNQTKEILGETESKFKSLRLQIRQATIAFQEAEEKGDLKGMATAKKQLDDLNDQFELTTLKAMKFEDALATMPGVAGFVGQSIQGVDKAFKVLAANPILAIVTAVVSAFMFLKEALGKTKEGQAALNKVSQAFSAVMGPILALINTVAVPIFEKLADIIGKVGGAFSWFAEKLGVSKGQIAAATKDIDKVGQEAADAEADRLAKAKADDEKAEADRIAKRDKRIADAEKEKARKEKEAADAKKLAQDNINDNAAVEKSEKELARAKVKASEDEVQAIKDKQAAQDEDYQDQSDRINKLIKLETVGSSEYKRLVVERNNLDKGYLENKATNTKDLNKLNLDKIDNEKALNDKISELKISLIKDETEKENASIQNKLARDLEQLEKDKGFIVKSETEKESIRKLYRDQAAQAEQKVKDDTTKKEEEEKLKKLDSDLRFLQIKLGAQIEGTRGYFKVLREINKAAEAREIEDLKASTAFKALNKKEQEDAITAIQEKAARDRLEILKKEIISYGQMAASVISIGTQITAALGAIYENQMNKELKDAGDNQEKQEAIKKKYFEKNKKLQIVNATIQMFQSAISAFASMAAIPIVGPALGVIAAGAAIAMGIANINKIKSTQYESAATGGASGSESKSPPQASANLGKNYADGGMIGGKRHAEGGTMIEAEAGEAIMTRGAVTMFAPLLSQLNQMGGGTSFSRSAMTTSSDNPNTSNTGMEQSPIIVKSYVVSSDMTSTQEKNARLKDLSTL
jgi:hypothetical protein